MQRQAKLMGHPIPYAFAYYNISALLSNPVSSNVRSVIARIYNNIAAAINSHKKLPRFLVVVPDIDVIIHTNYFGWGVSFAIGAQMDWLINNIEKMIETRKEDLMQT